jgi:hypothetical protein
VEWEPGHRLVWDGPPLRWHVGAARPRGYFEVAHVGQGRRMSGSSWNFGDDPRLTVTR